jgi:hypothetical protein
MPIDQISLAPSRKSSRRVKTQETGPVLAIVSASLFSATTSLHSQLDGNSVPWQVHHRQAVRAYYMKGADCGLLYFGRRPLYRPRAVIDRFLLADAEDAGQHSAFVATAAPR